MHRREFLARAPAAPCVLAGGRQSNYTICLSRDASVPERWGAQELQSHLELMSDARFPIATGLVTAKRCEKSRAGELLWILRQTQKAGAAPGREVLRLIAMREPLSQ